MVNSKIRTVAFEMFQVTCLVQHHAFMPINTKVTCVGTVAPEARKCQCLSVRSVTVRNVTENMMEFSPIFK
jgi:hypothetical protein